MSNMDGTPTLYVYPGTGTDDDDDTVPGLAQSLDAAIDATGDELAQASPAALADPHVAQAVALNGAADAVSDALLDALGVPDADEIGDTNG